MFDLEKLEAGVPVIAASNLVLTRPLDTFHIGMIKQYFTDLASSTHWCGFAFLESVPEALRRTVMSDHSTKNLGIVLFSETPEQVRFIFRDIYDNYRLINQDGFTLYMADHLEAVLERFVNRPHF